MSLLPFRRLVTVTMAGLAGVFPLALRAQQDAAAVVQEAERERGALNSAGALSRLETAIGAAPSNYELLWRAAREASDLGEQSTDAARRRELHAKAEQYARRSVAANPRGSDGHFMLSVALGRTALNVGTRERVKYAADIRTAAMDAIRLEPGHAGALHVLGIWNAEIMRLNGMARFVARNFLGGKVFEQASWAEARRNLELAVANDPGRITHRRDLAQIYAEISEPVKAREACEMVARMPVTELNDTRYKRECVRLIGTLR